MQKTIMITGSTDGLGLETAKRLLAQGHRVLLHGRSANKLQALQQTLGYEGQADYFQCDLSVMANVEQLARDVLSRYQHLDVLINNAGVFRTDDRRTADGFDVRFAVNTFAPYLLTQRLLPILAKDSRVINLSSAAQSSVDPAIMSGERPLQGDMAAYAQSKLALTQWSAHLPTVLAAKSPLVVSVNPGSLLATKMVKEAFGVAGKDISIGAELLVRAVLSDEFIGHSGEYFDNDVGDFSQPHEHARDAQKCAQLVRLMEAILGLAEE